MKRENRYIVLKITDIDKALSMSGKDQLYAWCGHIEGFREGSGKAPLECVVVESDWPEYEPTWAAIAARVDGQPSGIKFGIEHQYVITKTGRKCYVTAVDCEDGACLIVELYDEDGLDVSGELRRVEASELTEACMI